MAEQDSQKKIALGADHAGFKVKNQIADRLAEMGIEFVDFGPDSDDSTDYPDYAVKVAEAVSKAQCTHGILVCGSGVGMSMTANKVRGIRAALCVSAEMARLSRQHNDSNVLCIGARLENHDPVADIVGAWMEAEFEGGRHARRVDKIHTLTGV